MTLRKLALTAAFTAMSAVAVQAQTSGPEKMQGADTQKMKEECESRKGEQQAAEAKAVISETAMKKDESADSNKSSESYEDRLRKMTDTEKDPKEVNKEIVENTKTAPDGAKVAETGQAKPVENWFGCPPEKDKDAKSQ